MSLTFEQKKEVIGTQKRSDNDTGSPEVQIALLTRRIKDLTGHIQENQKDHSSRRGLLKMVGQRKRLLTYLKRKNIEKYISLIKELGIRG